MQLTGCLLNWMVIAMSDDELEALKEQTSQGDRIDEAAEAEEARSFVDDIVSELKAIDAGEQQKTVSVWDGHLAAFIRALEDNPDRMDDVGHALQQRLDVEETEIDRSEILRLALRLGFREGATDEFESVREAVEEHASRGL
jgi:hypothetical protein